MKLVKKLTVDDEDIPIVSESLALELDTPGRGIIVARAEKKLSGAVKFHLGYNGEYRRYFTGYVETCQQVDAKQQRLTVRELAAGLARPVPVSMRHVSAKDVLNQAARITGLKFTLENADWRRIIIPQAVNLGTGYDLMDFIGRECRIKNFIWQALPEGEIYIGSWNGSPNGDVVLQIPVELFTQVSSFGGTIQTVPKFRPGLRIRIGNGDPVFVTKVETSGSTMRLNWTLNPFTR